MIYICKGTDIFRELSKKRVYLIFFRKNFGSSKKSTTFASANQRKLVCKRELGYGVMVTLQILVLPFLVRVRVPQQQSFTKVKLLLFLNGS